MTKLFLGIVLTIVGVLTAPFLYGPLLGVNLYLSGCITGIGLFLTIVVATGLDC
jgi:hypothetical protein